MAQIQLGSDIVKLPFVHVCMNHSVLETLLQLSQPMIMVKPTLMAGHVSDVLVHELHHYRRATAAPNYLLDAFIYQALQGLVQGMVGEAETQDVRSESQQPTILPFHPKSSTFTSSQAKNLQSTFENLNGSEADTLRAREQVAIQSLCLLSMAKPDMQEDDSTPTDPKIKILAGLRAELATMALMVNVMFEEAYDNIDHIMQQHNGELRRFCETRLKTMILEETGDL
ncbi:hypothetical protein LTS09_018129 [Friedmanniomyces endolithicus]|nr:hypothetical protein LTS09_018129 [Friedmanniomyces endolithicus]